MLKRTKKTKPNKKKSHSSYWLNGWDDTVATKSLSVADRKTHDLYKLASAKRAISNFVTILTDKVIPVHYNTEGQSYTDGKQVVIGTEVQNSQDFDVVVGLALHEGSHIKLSDFEIVKGIQLDIPDKVLKKATDLGITNSAEHIKNILNVVEDRRIDFFVFNKAPGYRNYYRAMYDKFFNSVIIDLGLRSNNYREETVDSYMYRLINIHNKNTDLTALKGLRKIFNLINLKKIDRLETTYDAYGIAKDIWTVILSNVDKAAEAESQEKKKSDQESKGSGSGDEKELTDEEFQELLDKMDEQSGGSEGSGNGGGTPIKLTPKQQELLEKKIQQQKDFMDGDTQKGTVSQDVSENVQEIESSGTEIQNVGQSLGSSKSTPRNGYGSFKGIDVIVVNRMTLGLMKTSSFPMASSGWGGTELYMKYSDEVQQGIRLGTILGKKLQVRSENRSTIYNRQKVGRIDKRMISSLGFGNENVFTFTETDRYKKANLHISIDASGSMNGVAWSQSMINVVALCKAVDMISNLSIQVSFRTTSGRKPYIVMAYDSRVDKFSKVKQLFPALDPGGTTPEALCFEAIMKDFLKADNDTDSYFVNISDGEPYFHGQGFYYSGEPAFKHTRKMMKQIEGMGIKTISYFVDSYSTRVSGEFKKMYGKSARAIKMDNIGEITKTMNKLFLEH